MTTTTKRITDFRISWTADHEQFYPGHSLVFTDYTHSGQGYGETLREAFEDALDQLAEHDIDLSGYHIIHELTGENKMLSVEQEMFADLAGQVKKPEMLDWDIVKAECSAKGEHLKLCPLCDGTGFFKGPFSQELSDHVADCNGEVIDEDPDCAVCAGEWHFYVNVDVKVEDK